MRWCSRRLLHWQPQSLPTQIQKIRRCLAGGVVGDCRVQRLLAGESANVPPRCAVAPVADWELRSRVRGAPGRGTESAWAPSVRPRSRRACHPVHSTLTASCAYGEGPCPVPCVGAPAGRPGYTVRSAQPESDSAVTSASVSDVLQSLELPILLQPARKCPIPDIDQIEYRTVEESECRRRVVVRCSWA